MQSFSSPVSTSEAASVEQKTDQVMDAAETFVLEQAVSSRQRELFAVALDGLRKKIQVQPRQESETPFLFIHLPLRVFAALRGEDTRAIPLAVATTLMYLGMDILDDLADGDLPEIWSAYRPEEINLIAVTLLTALPMRIFVSLDAPPTVRLQIIGLMADAGLLMSAGQQGDLAMAGRDDMTSAEVIAAVQGKSGGEFALFAALAALMAGVSPAQVARLTELGRAIGTAAQLFSDWCELFPSIHSRDLASGTRTLPIVMQLERLRGTERQAFVKMLEEARCGQEAQNAVRKQLEAAGIAFQSAFAVEAHSQRARRLFREAELQSPSADGLEFLLRQFSLFDALAISVRSPDATRDAPNISSTDRPSGGAVTALPV